MILQTRTRKRKTKIVSKEVMEKMFNEAQTINAKAELIQMLVPLGLEAVSDVLREEVKRLAGAEYSRDSAASRWGVQAGSVFLGMRNSA